VKFRTIAAFLTIFVGCQSLLTLPGCSSSESARSTAQSQRNRPQNNNTLWEGKLDDRNWKQHWGIRNRGDWGWENLEVIDDETGKFNQIIRVFYPAGSASPRVSRREERPIGGSQFYADLGMEPRDRLRLSYYVRFSENFDFVKGGKLPGLFGGRGNSGGKIPDGTDGFSTRYMWRRDGKGEVYAYLPTSEEYGTSIGRGSWQFQPGRWYHLEQVVTLNDPDENNGRVRVYVDGTERVDRQNLTFRTTEVLKIEGLFFSTFFGGGNASWATPRDVYIDFADFSVSDN